MPSILPGQTYLAKTGSPTDISKSHLYAVLTEPVDTATRKGCIVWVPWSSVKEKRFHDATCILDVGDHPFIIKKTWVNYQRAAIVTAEEIRKNLGRGLLTESDPLKDQVLDQMLKGLTASDDTPMEVAQFYDFYLSLP